MFKHILLATDGSAVSEHAVRIAVELARTHGAVLTALYVIEPYPYLNVGESNPIGFQSYMAAAGEHASQAHAKVAALCKHPGTPVTLRTRRAEELTATEGILNTALEDGADLIVVGSHGRSGIVRLILGSTANKVVAQSPVPVLVAR
jgi:nucleotide-binding universal stress UspA family protein